MYVSVCVWECVCECVSVCMCVCVCVSVCECVLSAPSGDGDRSLGPDRPGELCPLSRDREHSLDLPGRTQTGQIDRKNTSLCLRDVAWMYLSLSFTLPLSKVRDILLNKILFSGAMLKDEHNVIGQSITRTCMYIPPLL